MEIEEKKNILEEIIKQRCLPYSIELLDVQGNKYTVRNDFGSTFIFVKKGDQYILEEGE
jgi:hypothetical protein